MRKFDYNQVTPLKNSMAYEKMQTNLKFILSLSVDDLLFSYRKNAGLSTNNAKGLTGWETYGHFLSGHYLGHYLSSCAISYATYKESDKSASELLLQKIDELLLGLEECQKAFGINDENYGFLGAFLKEDFDFLEQKIADPNHHVPYYKYQKMLSGLCCVYELTGRELALTIAKEMANYVIRRFETLSEETIQEIINTKWYNNNDQYEFHMEFGGMHFALLKLFQLSHEEKYRLLANKFRRKWFDDMLLSDDDRLGFYSLHSNTELPCVKGLLDDYKINRNSDDIKRVENFMGWIEKSHQLVTGGISGRSAYPSPADYGSELFEYPNMFYKHTTQNSGESCCSHILNEISSDLICLSNDLSFADSFEKRYFNAVYAQQRKSDCGYVYNLCARNNAHKHFSINGYYCCNASGIEAHANLCNSICFKDEKSILITQYIPMEINVDGKNFKIIQHNDLFETQSAFFEIQAEREEYFTLVLRLPKWSKQIELFVNGEKCELTTDSKVEITRLWKNGDKVELLMPFDIKLYSLPDRFDMFAVYYGPFLMAYLGEEKTFDYSKTEFVEYVRNKISIGEYIPLMNVGEENYNLFTILPNENKYDKLYDLTVSGGEFTSPNEKWYIKIDYTPTDKNAVCFDILINGEVCFTQSFKANGEDYLEYLLYPVEGNINKQISLTIRPKTFEGKYYDDISVIKEMSIIKAI